MANLLPHKELTALAHERTRRFIRALFVLVGGVFVFGIVSLVPSAVASIASRDAIEERLETTKRLVELQKSSGAGESVAQTKEIMQILQTVNDTLPVEATLARIIRVVPAGVSVQNITFTRGAESPTIDLSGSAMNRTSLIAFGDALRGTGLFTDVHIPIEALAQNTDLHFRLTLVIAPTND